MPVVCPFNHFLSVSLFPKSLCITKFNNSSCIFALYVMNFHTGSHNCDCNWFEKHKIVVPIGKARYNFYVEFK